MPIKYNLTKFDKIAERIQAVAAKNNQNDRNDNPTEEETIIKMEAVIITAMCSAFSYQTSKSLMNGAVDLGSDSVKEEHMLAREGKWKRIRNIDVQEVANMNIKDGLFYTWMHYNVAKGEQDLYKRAWESLKANFNEACDEVGVERERT
jgi:hypothetical protein